jgi:hypothetical protein
MRQLKYLERLEPFTNVPLFTSAEAEKQGVPRHALAYLVKRGTLERLYHLGRKTRPFMAGIYSLYFFI